MSDPYKMNVAESEKLSELVSQVKSIEANNEEALKSGGGTTVEDSLLDRAKRQVDAYKKYLAGKYNADPESFVVNLDKKEEKPVAGESGVAETVNVEPAKAAGKPVK
jgi:GTP cyclohydrolase I